MLRRAPTTLSITSEDVAAYEDRRIRDAMAAAQQREAAAAQQQREQGTEMEGVQASPGEQQKRAREERIGVGRRGR